MTSVVKTKKGRVFTNAVVEKQRELERIRDRDRQLQDDLCRGRLDGSSGGFRRVPLLDQDE